jgi:glycosyltransferase involved in cell wall biosynthesis
LKVAIVHDWLVVIGGAERVLGELLKHFPGADVYTLVDDLSTEQRASLGLGRVVTSPLQRFAWLRRRYRALLPIMPLMVEAWDLRAYDLVVSSSHSVAKGVLTHSGQVHYCLCYTPARYAWDQQHDYLEARGWHHGLRSWIARSLLQKFRIWDFQTAQSVDAFIAISHFVSLRIAKAYRRDSIVIYPPVDLHRCSLSDASERGDYLCVSRLVPYKRIDLVIKAFNRLPHLKLQIIGDGPVRKSLQAMAGANVSFSGWLSDHDVVLAMQDAKAFVFAAEDDFGITPLEAQACGTPVIALARGGVLETLGPKDVKFPNVVFFEDPTEDALIGAIDRFETSIDRVNPTECRKNAMRFSTQRFHDQFQNFLMGVLREHDPIKSPEV